MRSDHGRSFLPYRLPLISRNSAVITQQSTYRKSLMKFFLEIVYQFRAGHFTFFIRITK